MTTPTGLPGPEVEALVKRYLDGEPAVTVRDLRRGLGFLCGPVFADGDPARRLFAVATDGGVLLRLDEATRQRVIDNGLGEPNIALPDWVLRGVPDAAHKDSEAAGQPDEWVWIPVTDGTSFERRRPHIHEALAYCRHCMTSAP